jgi:hypothetical protein
VPDADATRAAARLAGQPDPRIAAAVERALGDARSVAVVGPAAYESPQREVTAVGTATGPLTLGDDTVDAVFAPLTGAGWRGDPAELRRVARTRVVVLTYDAEHADALWLVRDYLPELAAAARARFPPVGELVDALGGPERATAERLPIPHDCRDGLVGAFWRRPERYLDPGLPVLAELDSAARERGLGELRIDLDSGAWRRRYGGLLSREELDVGYRLVVARVG